MPNTFREPTHPPSATPDWIKQPKDQHYPKRECDAKRKSQFRPHGNTSVERCYETLDSSNDVQEVQNFLLEDPLIAIGLRIEDKASVNGGKCVLDIPFEDDSLQTETCELFGSVR